MQVELYKEMKKCGSSRRLRMALCKFADLSPSTRPQKRRAFMANLVPVLVKAARRNEDESVQEAMAKALPKILSVFGIFATDNEIKSLLKVFSANLFCAANSPAVLRSSALIVASVAASNKRPAFFLPWTLGVLLDHLSPDVEANEGQLRGPLICLRYLLEKISANSALINDNNNSGNNNNADFVKRLLQIYELGLGYLDSRETGVVVHSLEVLQQLLKTPVKSLTDSLTSFGGMEKSFCEVTDGVTSRSGMRRSMSRGSSIAFSEYDDSFLEADDDHLLPSPRVNVEDEEISVDHDKTTTETEAELPRPPIAELDRRCDEEEEETTGSREDVLSLPESVASAASSNQHHNFGHFLDKDLPLIFCARKIAYLFLLGAEKGQTAKNVRISVKLLSFGVLNEILRMAPKVFLLTVIVDADEEDLSSSLIRDLIHQYADHDDPQVRGSVAALCGAVIRGGLIESGGDLGLWFNNRRPDQNDILATTLKKMASDEESGNAFRSLVSSCNAFLPRLLTSGSAGCARLGLDLLETIARRASKMTYWLVKIELADLLSRVPFMAIADSEFQSRFLDIFRQYLNDEDARVRKAVSRSLAEMVDNLFYPSDWSDRSSTVCAAVTFAERLLHPISGTCTSSFSSIALTSGDKTLHRIVAGFFADLSNAKDLFAASGRIEALTALAGRYPPEKHLSSWGCDTMRYCSMYRVFQLMCPTEITV